jgi:hypothetical protein
LKDLCHFNISTPLKVTCIGDVVKLLQKNDGWK